MEGNTDVVEICAMLQCLGYNVKSMDTTDSNLSQDGAVRSIVINCQSSGLHVVLESTSTVCSCPTINKQNSGFWQVSGMAGGKQQDKESGSTLLGSLSKNYRDHLTKELAELVKGIKLHNDDQERPKEANRSTSMLEMKTPEKLHMKIKIDTPTRYRSLDTLTANDDVQPLPAPRKLARVDSDTSTEAPDTKKIMCRRQSTYTVGSSPNSFRRRNKTSSPIQPHPHNILDELVAAEKVAESLRKQLSSVIKEIMEDAKNDSSMSSLVLDVSKISILKEPNRNQFASSPNLSGLGTREELTKSRLKRFDSASTSKLNENKPPTKDMKSRLRRLSPSFFKTKKDSPSIVDRAKTDSKSKLNNLFRPKIVTPVRIPRLNPESSPNLSASKKKYSHIKSTIPRATKRD